MPPFFPGVRVLVSQELGSLACTRPVWGDGWVTELSDLTFFFFLPLSAPLAADGRLLLFCPCSCSCSCSSFLVPRSSYRSRGAAWYSNYAINHAAPVRGNHATST